MIKRYPILAVVAALLVAAVAVAARPSQSAAPLSSPAPTATSTSAGSTLEAGTTTAKISGSRPQPSAPRASAASTAPASISLSIGSTTLAAPFVSGETVEEAMDALAAHGELSFTEKQYPGMGAFVESIDGAANANGKYWILYVDGAQAQVGISSLVLHAGDAVQWRYEKSIY